MLRKICIRPSCLFQKDSLYDKIRVINQGNRRVKGIPYIYQHSNWFLSESLYTIDHSEDCNSKSMVKDGRLQYLSRRALYLIICNTVYLYVLVSVV